ncbi:ADP-ribosylglycohydrolase family protein, partial [Burkholderia gladioli]|nr:ADP-ribosylglycohydrolase family protein [Burkholderia gladioli]
MSIDRTDSFPHADQADAARLDRARGAFYGLALGDAFGMPTQALSRETIRERFGRVTGLLDAGPDQPIAPNMRAG